MGKLCKRVFLLGGWINEREGATKGQFMAEQLKSFHVDKCILSGAALGKNLILSSYYESDMHFQKLAMEARERPFFCWKRKIPGGCCVFCNGCHQF